MIIYRLTTGEHSTDLSGTGARLFGGRWNSAGLHALYTTSHISLAVLENLVHVKKYRVPPDYHLISILIPERIKPVVISKEKLKKNWKDDVAYSQFMGDEFLKGMDALILQVPSVIVDEETNYIINPRHADAGKLKISASRLFKFDKRLFLDNE